jgi:hypothetical protein
MYYFLMEKYYNIVELPDCFPIHSTAGLIHSPSEYLCLLLTLTCTVPTALAIPLAKNKETEHQSILDFKIKWRTAMFLIEI